MKTLQLKFGENKLNSTQLLLVKGGNLPLPGKAAANENHTNHEGPVVIDPTL